ncbi:MAG TPA: ATP-binding protein [Gammaproteobacteria bacterium]|nr:ATP-binding protein [Gammaproteobacteria bacterium]
MERLDYSQQITKAYRTHPVVALLGPRQCGKTTLAKQYIKQHKELGEIHYFDLEDPTDLAKLDNPMLAFSSLEGLIVIDEIQRRPELFPVLRVLVDEKKAKRFLILGSASRELIQQSSETLAGRIAYIELMPFSFPETHDLEKLWIRGGFPLSYLGKTLEDSIEWRKFYIQTFLEQDIPALGIQIPPQALRRFWMMLAHYHGNIFNASEIGRSLGIADTTVRRYLDILTYTFMVRQLQPWFENINKRQVKSPKIYFRDSGIFHSLIDATDPKLLHRHPKLGASWEGLVVEEIIRKHHAEPGECYFWGVHSQAELDLLIFKNGKRLGFEIKYADAPKLSKSMITAYETLHLDELKVIYPGKKDYKLSENIEVCGAEHFLRKSDTGEHA